MLKIQNVVICRMSYLKHTLTCAVFAAVVQ